MIVSLLFQLKVFLFIMAILVVIYGILHVASVFALHKGQLIESLGNATIFGMSLSYVLTMLICGF